MYLVFDTSAIGHPKSWKAPVSDTFNWPRMIHISWIILNNELKPVEDFNCPIKPVGFDLTQEIADRHSLDPDKMAKTGNELEEVLVQFSASIDKVDYIFSHNLRFNENVVGAEFIRTGIKHHLHSSERYCLMQEATYYCKLPKKTGGFKWPTLQEMHAIMFKQKYSPANNARADVIAASRCFILMMKTGALADIFD